MRRRPSIALTLSLDDAEGLAHLLGEQWADQGFCELYDEINELVEEEKEKQSWR